MYLICTIDTIIENIFQFQQHGITLENEMKTTTIQVRDEYNFRVTDQNPGVIARTVVGTNLILCFENCKIYESFLSKIRHVHSIILYS